MKIAKLYKERYVIAEVVECKNGEDKRQVTEFFSNQEKCYQANVDGLIRVLEHIAANGFEGLSSKLLHRIDQNGQIFELIKGRLRLCFFRGEGNMIVIATHGFIKKTQKTPKSEQNRVKSYKKQYDRALKQGNLEILEVEEDE